MSDRKLFTRRQILSVFGGATGLAIVGVEGQETSTNGNLLGGTSNMAQAYKVGEGTYKGPLSVRSDVPQEDGITFIQTDAGSNNDMFAIQHYNGGWSEQGLDLPSVNTEKATINKFASSADYTIGIASDGSYFAVGTTNTLKYEGYADIHALINQLISDEGGVDNGEAHIHIKGGQYTYSSTLNLGVGTWITGEGFNVTVLTQADGANVDAIHYGPISSAQSSNLPFLGYFKHVGNKSNNTSGNGLFADASGDKPPKDLHMFEYFIGNMPENGIVAQYTFGWRMINSYIEFCEDDGFLFQENGASLGGILMWGNYIKGNTDWGINCESIASGNYDIQDCQIYSWVDENGSGGAKLGATDAFMNGVVFCLHATGNGGDGVKPNNIGNSVGKVIADDNSNYGYNENATVGGSFNLFTVNGGPGNSAGLINRNTSRRHVVNGRAVNDGDPSTGGAWETFASKSADLNALIEDQTNDTFYRGLSSGSFTTV